MAIADRTIKTIKPGIARTRPKPVTNNVTWLILNAPYLTMTLPQPACTAKDTAAIIPTYTPSQEGSIFNSKRIGGAITAGNTLPIVTNDCCINIKPRAIESIFISVTPVPHVFLYLHSIGRRFFENLKKIAYFK